MEMNIEVGCLNCQRSVYRAIGEFLATNEWLSNIVSVDVFELTLTSERVLGRVVPMETSKDTIGACIGWDVHPCRDQIRHFRKVWDQETGLCDVTVIHDAPSSIPDVPGFATAR